MKKLMFALLFVVLFASFVSSTPASATQNGWVIRSEIPDTIKMQDVEYDFHAHVADATTGEPIITTASCALHVYDVDGTHLFEGVDDAVSHTYDYSWKIDMKNFTIGIEHPYIIQCNGTYATDDEGGFIGDHFKVTETGFDDEDGTVTVFLMVFAVFVYLLLLYSLLIIMKDFADGNANFMTIGWGFASYICNMALYYYLTNYLPMPLMLDISELGLTVFGTTHLVLPMIAIVFSWIKNRGIE